MQHLDFELAYLALLTKAGLKPLSRWEKDAEPNTAAALRALGLKTRVVERSVASGARVRELIFSESDRCLEFYAARFDRTPISRDRRSARLEGLLFGYPSCCVESYAARGYVKNTLDPRDQRILFHWACANCAITPLLTPHYRRLYRECRQAGRGGRLEWAPGRLASPAARSLKRAMAMAAALAALGSLPSAWAHAVVNPDPHWLPLAASEDPDGDLLASTEEAILGLDPNYAHQNNGLDVDGVALARAWSQTIDALPTEPSSAEAYLVHHMAWGLETCQVCGDSSINMGFMEVVNPKTGDSYSIPYIGKHFLEHGSFSYNGSLHSGRVAPPKLQVALTGQGDFHHVPVAPAPDTDQDRLSNQEEQDLKTDSQNPDENQNGFLDGVELARALAAEISALPTAPTTESVYRRDFEVKGLERCAGCGETVNMGHLTVCNPQAELYAKLPYIALHYLEHGNFSFAGDVHGLGRADVKLLADALRSPGPSHLRKVNGDTDGDGLKDREEDYFKTDKTIADTDNDGVPDGFRLARELGLAVEALPRQTNGTCYAVDHLLRGLVYCDVCGLALNMGWVEVINPKESLNLKVPYLALHAMRNGSFGYTAQDRLNPMLLDLALRADGTSHQVLVAGDADKDGLLDKDEPYFGMAADKPDSDGDGMLDGTALARKLHAQVQALPDGPLKDQTYLLRAEADCYAPCPVCGEDINCGHVDVISPWSGLSQRISYLNLHYMERGSLASSPDNRVDPVLLNAILRPSVLISAGAGQVTLHWHGAAGRTYQVYTAPEATGPWQPGAVVMGEGELTFTEPTAPGAARRFYRVVAR